MGSSTVGVSRAVFGESRRVAAATILLAILLGSIVRILTIELNPQMQLRSAAPLGFPGVFFVLVLPVIVGYILWVNRGLVPTFFVSFVPVFVFYGAVRYAPPVVGAINDAPAPVSQPRVWKLGVLYWLLGICVALSWHYADKSVENQEILPNFGKP